MPLARWSSARKSKGLGFPARIALYNSLKSPPKVVEVRAATLEQFLEELPAQAYRLSQEKGGKVPYPALKEVVENLIHASFEEVVVAILDNGNTIRVSDQGPGIKNKEKAFGPGYSTATAEMKKVIRGVGSGLPLAKEVLNLAGGEIFVDNNLEGGTVVTLSLPSPTAAPQEEKETPRWGLSERQKRVLFLVTELGASGPAKVAQELEISLSSAYRDLKALEKLGLIKTNEKGKRSLSPEGIKRLDQVMAS